MFTEREPRRARVWYGVVGGGLSRSIAYEGAVYVFERRSVQCLLKRNLGRRGFILS